MSIYHMISPFKNEDLAKLRAGDTVFISGEIYVARDAAHKRMCETINNNELPPFNLQGQTIYYMGPTPTRPGNIIGSCGPTTSSRMDKYTPLMLENGIKAVIGKGARSLNVNKAFKDNGAVYLMALGGCGALVAQNVYSCQTIAYEDLGAEAILLLRVADMQTVVILDNAGGDLIKKAPVNINVI
ncbi:MAG: FumA C-terminus/TtdB family hydratase beta subunit [Chloroflexi bacterium]|nr:FumA C-terminus/TtdB family hydratase beta subunit [Chloroflexota bacterium]